jgi:hypothetical protein
MAGVKVGQDNAAGDQSMRTYFSIYRHSEVKAGHGYNVAGMRGSFSQYQTVSDELDWIGPTSHTFLWSFWIMSAMTTT